MGEKDIIEKTLTAYNDVFADIINGLLFGGENVVKAENLEDLQVSSYYKTHNGRLGSQERDVFKNWRENPVRAAVIGIENQSRICPSMPIRVISYDAGEYRRQLSEHEARLRLVGRKSRQQNNPEEDGSRISPFHPVPVITLVLYFGSEHWANNTRLKNILDIPARLEPFVNDYRINVFEVAWLSDEEISHFDSDFRIIANFFSQKRRNPNYIPNDLTDMIHPDEVLELIASIVGDARYLHVNDDAKKGKVKNMCEVADRLENMGRKKGLIEGKKEGILKILTELVNDGILSISEAARRAHMSVQGFRKAAGIK